MKCDFAICFGQQLWMVAQGLWKVVLLYFIADQLVYGRLMFYDAQLYLESCEFFITIDHLELEPSLLLQVSYAQISMYCIYWRAF